MAPPSSIEVSNPGTRRVNGRRGRLSARYKDPRWDQMKKDHIHPDSVCVYCLCHDGEQRRNRRTGELQFYPTGKKAGQPILVKLTINHKDRDSYRTDDEYLTWNPETMEVCCVYCNGKIEQGLKPCPVCGVRYVHWTHSGPCRDCREAADPELKKQREEREAMQKENNRIFRNAHNRKKSDKIRKAAHPCKKRGLEQRCHRKPGLVCTYTAKKAEDCAPAVKNGWLRKQGVEA
jgi:hypothetical protein